MAVDEKGAAVARSAGAGQPCVEDAPPVIRDGRDAGRRIVADPGRDLEPIDLEAERRERRGELLLGARLGAQDAGLRHQPLEQLERIFGAERHSRVQVVRDLGQS